MKLRSYDSGRIYQHPIGLPTRHYVKHLNEHHDFIEMKWIMISRVVGETYLCILTIPLCPDMYNVILCICTLIGRYVEMKLNSIRQSDITPVYIWLMKESISSFVDTSERLLRTQVGTLNLRFESFVYTKESVMQR